MLRWLLLFIAIAIAAWLYGNRTASPTATSAPGAITGTTTGSQGAGGPPLSAVACTLPPRLAGPDVPIQSDVPGSMSAPIAFNGATLHPLAGFSVAARVLSRKEYDSGRESYFSPLDLTLGWGRMRDDAVLSRLDIRQSNRWYHYQWSGDAPLPPDEIARSSANMHMIPANPAIADALEEIDTDDNVRIDGWLVQVDAPDGWRWRSSMTRDDTGAGACEVIYVCGVRR